MPFLFFGTYRVTAELKGFKRTQAENITLSTSEDARVDLSMAVGDVSEQVFVSAQEVLLKTEEASVSTTIGQQMVVNLPFLGRLSGRRFSPRVLTL